MHADYWPRLQKVGGLLPYVRTDFGRWAWEGDQSDDIIINARTDSCALVTNNGQHSMQVIITPTSARCGQLANGKKGWYAYKAWNIFLYALRAFWGNGRPREGDLGF